MKKNKFFSRLCAYAVILCATILSAIGLFAQVNTVVRLPATTVAIPSFKVVPTDAANLLVSAESTTSKNMSYLQFDLSGIPADAIIATCTLRLILAADPSDRTSVVVHQVVNDNMNSPSISETQLDSKTIQKEDNPKNSVVLLNNIPVSTLQQALSKKKFTIRLSTTFRNGTSAFYSSKLSELPPQQQDPAFIPRLVIGYTLELPQSTWAAYHADAQHTAMSTAIFLGTIPVDHAIKNITQFNNNIQKNMLLYKDKIYLVAQDGLSSFHLYAVDPVTGLVTQAVSNMRVPEVMGAIDAFGRYHHITDSITVVNLEGNAIGPRIALPGNTIVKAPPTIGKDGTLYLATRFYVYAFSPYPRYDLLWQYVASSESMSAVTLSPDESTAYIVFADPLKLIAINTVSAEGREIILNRTPGLKNGNVIPAVNNKGQIFVTDGFPSGNNLYVINKALTLDTTISGVKISQPVVGGDGTVYYADKGNLMSLKDNVVLELAKGVGEVTNMVTDAGNNIYCWTSDNRLLGFAKNGAPFLNKQNPLSGLSREWDMTLSTDGSLYTGTSTRLYSIRASAFTPATYTFTKDDLDYNNRTFRADIVTVPATLSFERGYSTTLVGSPGTELEFAL